MTHKPIVGAALDGAQVAAVFDREHGGSPAEFGALLESSGIDFVVLRFTGDGIRFDPSIAATVLARHTHSVGLVVVAAPLRDHPYNLARRLGSIDFVSGGRVGWLVPTDDDAAVDGRSAWTSAPRGAVPADAVIASRELWESWPPESIVDDRERGIFAESSRIRYVDHVGAHNITGPLNIPEPPQGKLPIFVETPVPAEYASLAAVADVVLGAGESSRTRPVLPWRAAEAAPAPIAAHVAGVVIGGGGPPAGIVAAAGRYVTGPAEIPVGTTLRARLGLPAPVSVLGDRARPAFPAA